MCFNLMAEDESSWIDEGAEYSPKSEFSKPSVVEDATRKCFELRSKEMKKGYFNTKFTKEGMPLKVWIEDSRKAYCSSVIALKHLLMPEILADKITNKKGKKKRTPVYKDIKLGTILKKYSYFILEKKEINGKTRYIKTDRYYMPEMDESIFIRKIFPDDNEELLKINGRWNPYVNAYWDHMVKKCDLMFSELMRVIHRLNYFKQSLRMG